MKKTKLFILMLSLFFTTLSYAGNFSVGLMQFSSAASGTRLGLESGALPWHFLDPEADHFIYASYDDFRISNAYYLNGSYRNSDNSILSLGIGTSRKFGGEIKDKRFYFKIAPTSIYADKNLMQKQFSMGLELGFGLDILLNKAQDLSFYGEGAWRLLHHLADKLSKKDFFNGAAMSIGIRYFY
jgi:hypothetical protein